MQVANKISPEWKNWIHENLERGCRVQTIVSTMVDKKFDLFTAVESVLSEAAQIPGRSAAINELRDRLKDFPQLAPEWRLWVTERLENGWAPQPILQHMLKNKVNPVSALLWVFSEAAKHSPSRAGATEEPSRTDNPYDYSNPRFSYTGNAIHAHDRDVRVRLRLAAPIIAVIDDVLSDEECEEIIQLARSRVRRSTVVDNTSGDSVVNDHRTSSGTFIKPEENDLMRRINQRLAALMQMPVEHGEDIQILRYEVGQQYKPHQDFFDPNASSASRLLRDGGQRVSTLVVYLNEVIRGGETVFPDVGLSVAPKKGSAVYFEYCNGFGQLDYKTLHGGAPVLEGEKWALTKWMRYHRFR